MDWKKIGKSLLFPHISVLLFLLPVGLVLLVYSMITLEETSPVRIASYTIAFYTLLIWCVRVPSIILFFQSLKRENKYIKAWATNPRLRMNITLSGNILWNGAYAALQLGMGIYHHSAWFYSLAAYYILLAAMRFLLVRHTVRHRPGEQVRSELAYYRACGWVFLLMNLALSGMMFYMIHENRTVHHHEITTIAMAAYTFTALTLAIVNVIRYRKYNSPAMSAAKAISLAAACVSMLTLENTMLTTFSSSDMTPQIKHLFLALSGGAVSVFIIVMAIYMIVQSNLKIQSTEDGRNGKQEYV